MGKEALRTKESVGPRTVLSRRGSCYLVSLFILAMGPGCQGVPSAQPGAGMAVVQTFEEEPCLSDAFRESIRIADLVRPSDGWCVDMRMGTRIETEEGRTTQLLIADVRDWGPATDDLLAVVHFSGDKSRPKDRVYYPLCLRHNMSALLASLRDAKTSFAVKQEIATFLRPVSGLDLKLSPGKELANQRAINDVLAWWGKSQKATEEAWLRYCLTSLIKALGHESPHERRFAARTLRAHTGRDFGFVADGSLDERRRAIGAWKDWGLSKLRSDAWLQDAAISSVSRTRVLAAYAMSRDPDGKYVKWLVALCKREAQSYQPSRPSQFEPRASALAFFALAAVGAQGQLVDAGVSLPRGASDFELAKAYVELQRGNASGLRTVQRYLGESAQPYYGKERYVHRHIALYCAERFCSGGPVPEEAKLGPGNDLSPLLEAKRRYFLRWQKWIQENRGRLKWNSALKKFEVRS